MSIVVLASREAEPSKENIQHFKKGNFINLFLFLCCESESRDPIESGSGYGSRSTTLANAQLRVPTGCPAEIRTGDLPDSRLANQWATSTIGYYCIPCHCLDLDWTVRHGRSSVIFVLLHESPEVLYTDAYSAKGSRSRILNFFDLIYLPVFFILIGPIPDSIRNLWPPRPSKTMRTL